MLTKKFATLTLALLAITAELPGQDSAYEELLQTTTTVDLTGEPSFRMTFHDIFVEAFELGGLWIDDGNGGYVAAGANDDTVTVLQTNGSVTIVTVPTGCGALWVEAPFSPDPSTGEDDGVLGFFPGLRLELGMMLEGESVGEDDDGTGVEAAVAGGDPKTFQIPKAMIIWPIQLGECWRKVAGKKKEKCKTTAGEKCSIIVFTSLGMFGGISDCDGQSHIQHKNAGGAEVLVGQFTTVDDPYPN